MRVAGHEYVFVLAAFLQQFVEESLHKPYYFLYLVAYKQLQVDKHLVVPRPSAVYLLAHVAETARKHQLDLRVNVLNAVLDGELSALACGVDTLQLGKKLLQLGLFQQSD